MTDKVRVRYAPSPTGHFTSGMPVQLYLTIYSRDIMVESSSSVSRILTAREILNTVKKAN